MIAAEARLAYDERPNRNIAARTAAQNEQYNGGGPRLRSVDWCVGARTGDAKGMVNHANRTAMGACQRTDDRRNRA